MWTTAISTCRLSRGGQRLVYAFHVRPGIPGLGFRQMGGPAGRQRVNWGVNLVWNPNDVFNTFSYFDFDYEERPGTDAVRVQYYTGVTSSAELVYKMGKKCQRNGFGRLVSFHHNWNYDFQFLGGWVGTDFVAGTGWSGDIRGAGFRGEITQFVPRKSRSGSKNSHCGIHFCRLYLPKFIVHPLQCPLQ